MTQEELEKELVGVKQRLVALETAPPPPPNPTLTQLKAEIESGPLAAELAPFWADVFEPHYKIDAKGEKVRNVALDFRIGRLKPDAAFEIHKRLTIPRNGKSRCDDMGCCNSWAWKMIADAKEAKE